MNKTNKYTTLGSISNVVGILVFILSTALLASMLSPLFFIVVYVFFYPWLVFGTLGGLAVMSIVFSVISTNHADGPSKSRAGLICGIGTLIAMAFLMVFFYTAFVGF